MSRLRRKSPAETEGRWDEDINQTEKRTTPGRHQRPEIMEANGILWIIQFSFVLAFMVLKKMF